jgi:glucosamine-6-phosphate deaminase
MRRRPDTAAPIRIVVCADRAAVAGHVAALVVDAVAGGGARVLGLPTGDTPTGIYRRLVAAHRAGRLSFRHVTTFNLDEYVGLAAGHPQSYAAYMRRHLLDHVDLAPAAAGGRADIPDGAAADPQAEAARYEAAIAAAGGLDLALLGLGGNGHIGFNEPGAAPGSRCRVVRLAPATVAANARHFAAPARPPRAGITMGVATILAARRIVLAASGRAKAAAVAAALRPPPTPACPASFLQTHGDATFVLDRDAAALIGAGGYAVEAE